MAEIDDSLRWGDKQVGNFPDLKSALDAVPQEVQHAFWAQLDRMPDADDQTAATILSSLTQGKIRIVLGNGKTN